MGCLLGCILFVIAVHRAFCAYAEESPISSMHGKTLAIVDDVNSTLHPPIEPHHHRDWLLKVLRSVEFLKDALEPLGLELSIAKCILVLPAHIDPALAREILAIDGQSITVRSMRSSAPIEEQGTRLYGVGVGTDDFVSFFTRSVVDKVCGRIGNLRGMHPQYRLRLLGKSHAFSIRHLCRNTPTQFVMAAAHVFDDGCKREFLDTLAPPGMADPLSCSTEREDRALKHAALRYKEQGANLLPASTLAPGDFWSSVAALAADMHFGPVREFFARFSNYTHDHLMDFMGGPDSLQAMSVSTLLDPAAPEDLHQGNFYPDLLEEDPKARIAKKISNATLSFSAHLVRDTYAASNHAGDIHESDVILANEVQYRADLFSCRLSLRQNRLSPADFVSMVRLHFRLTPLGHLYNGTPASSLTLSTTEHETCTSCVHRDPKARTVDLWNNHSRNCPNSKRAINKTAAEIDHTIARLAKEAGAVVVEQPSAVTLLKDQFTREECARLFFKQPTLAQLETIKRLLGLRAEAILATDPAVKAAKRAAFSAGLRTLPDPHIREGDRIRYRPGHNNGGLKLDLQITNPYNLKSVLVDHFVTHITKWGTITEHLEHTLRFRREQAAAKRTGASFDKLAPPPAIVNRSREKRSYYGPLLSVIADQFERGMRDDNPSFLVAGLTTTGFHSKEIVELQEFLAHTLKMKLAQEGPRDDGATPAELVARWRDDFRSSLQATIARGNARAQAASGLPPPGGHLARI